MKVFMSGASGALGVAMQHLLRRERISFLATDIDQLDIGDFKKTNATLLNYRPDVILNFAAISDVDACEVNSEQAFRVHALGSMGLATIARKIDAKILYTSTNFVFDGESEQPYTENSSPHPINEYGRTKLLGEHYIKDLSDRYFIVRTSWLFGMDSKTFLSKFIVSKDKPAFIDVICDQFASFTYIPDLAEALFVLLKSEYYGVYHLVNSGIGCWLDFALKAKERMNFKTDIRPVKTEELRLTARRPRYTPLSSTHYEFLFHQHMRTWERALADFIKSTTQKQSH